MVMLVRRQNCWGVGKFMLQAGRGEDTYKCNGIFHSLIQHRLWAEVLLIQHFDMVSEVAPLLIYLPSVLPLGFVAHQRGKRYWRPGSLQLSLCYGDEFPSWHLFKLDGQLLHSVPAIQGKTCG